jgi:ADP-ribose pyrophosphatase
MADGPPRIAWECPYWRAEARAFTGPDGQERTWWSAKRPNPHTVHMLGISPAGYVPVLRQWRVPCQQWVWELPAGLCDVAHEPPQQTAQRELIEETGYASGEVHLLFTGTVSPGLTDELYNAFLCLDLERAGEGGGLGGERLEVHLIPLWDLKHFLLAEAAGGKLVDAKILTHYMLAVDKLGQLAQEDYERTGVIGSKYSDYLAKLMYAEYMHQVDPAEPGDGSAMR